ncbi:MAG: hypothetical protein WC291_06725, partial [Thermodesulfovibrionales bacterium]
MNLILLTEKDFIAPDRVRLTDRRLRHAQDILKAKAGDSLVVGMENGLMGKGVITGLDKTCLEMDVAL